MKSIIAGEQYATIFKDTRQLAEDRRADGRRRAQGRQARGQQHQGLRQRREGRAVVPARVGDRGYKDNYQKVLVDSGYYTAGELGSCNRLPVVLRAG